MRRIKLAAHLSEEEIEARYRGASDGVGRSQWQIVWLLAQDKPSREVTGLWAGLDPSTGTALQRERTERDWRWAAQQERTA